MNARDVERSAWSIWIAAGAFGAAAISAVQLAVSALADEALYRSATIGAFGVALALGAALHAWLAPARAARLLGGALVAFGIGAGAASFVLDTHAPPAFSSQRAAQPSALHVLSAARTPLEPVCSNGLPSVLQERDRERVLLAGFGSGIDFACALQRGARTIDIAEPDAALRERALRSGAATLATSAHARLDWHATSARAFASGARGARYDLVLLPASRDEHTWPAGLLPIAEDTLRTDRGLGALLSKLAPQGELFAVEVGEPAALRFIGTTLLALRNAGVRRPAHHVVVHQSGESYGIRVRVAPFDLDEMLELHRRARAEVSEAPAPELDALVDGAERFPELRYVPGSRFQNRVSELLAQADAQSSGLAQRYAFDIAPVRDERALTSEWTRRDRPETWSSHSSFTVLPRCTLLALVFAFMFAAAARAWQLRAPAAGVQGSQPSKRTWFAFAVLGCAHGLVFAWSQHELALWLARPLQAFALALFVLLIGAGAGIGWGVRVLGHHGRPAARAHGIAFLSFAVITRIFDPALSAASGIGIALTSALATAVLGALGFALALPTAAAIDAAAKHAPPQHLSFLLPYALAFAVAVPLSATLILFAGYTALALAAVSGLTLVMLIGPRQPA